MKQKNEKTNHPYFIKVKEELEKLRESLIAIPAWKIEIEVINQKMSAYRDGKIPLPMAFPSNKTFKIDDILEKDETDLNNLESNITRTEYNLKIYNAYIALLDDEEQEVINRKYLDIKNKRTTYEAIGEDMNCSHTAIQNWHNSAINKMANYKYG